MPWCPKCGLEYRKGFTTCNDCSCELADSPGKTVQDAEPEYDREAFLISVGDSIEADMLEGLLKENGIPVLKKYKEAGDYLKIYMGTTNFGVDLYVPSHLLDMAAEVVKASKETLEQVGINESELEAQALEAGISEADPEQSEPEAQALEADISEADPGQYKPEKPVSVANSEEGMPQGSTEEQRFARKRRIITWIILLFFIPGLVWVVIGLIRYFIASL